MWGDSKGETSTSSPPGLVPVMSQLQIGFFLESESPLLSACLATERRKRWERNHPEDRVPWGLPGNRLMELMMELTGRVECWEGSLSLHPASEVE